MRILVLTNMYPPHHYGGYELSCKDVVDQWRRDGHDVLVLTSNMRLQDVVDPEREREDGVWRDLDIAFEGGDLSSPPRWRRLGRERANLRRLDAALEAMRPDVVSVWHMGAMSFTLLSALTARDEPIVYVVCDDWLSYGPKVDPWMRMFLQRPLLRRAVHAVTGVPTTVPYLGQTGAFCFVSALTRERSERYTSWTFPVSTVTYSGIDRRDFPPVVITEERPWRWRLLHVGRLDERKGVDTLIRAMADLPPETTLDVLGRGVPGVEAHLRALADEVGAADRVTFGAVTRNELRAWYAEADALLFLPDWDEPFGLVPVEAMACGTPVVTTAAGGSAEFLVDGVNCLVVPRGDARAVAAALQRLAAEPVLRSRIRAGGASTADDLTVDRLAAVLEEWHAAAATGFQAGYPAPRSLRTAEAEDAR